MKARVITGTLLIDKSGRRKMCPVCHDPAGLTIEKIIDHNNRPEVQIQIVCHNCSWIVSKTSFSAKIKPVIKQRVQ